MWLLAPEIPIVSESSSVVSSPLLFLEGILAEGQSQWIGARSSQHHLNEQVQHSDSWQKTLAKWVLINQLIKFHLVNFPCNKGLIMSKWEHFWALQQNGTAMTMIIALRTEPPRSSHTLPQWKEQRHKCFQSQNMKASSTKRGNGGFSVCLLNLSSNLFIFKKHYPCT